MLKANAYNYRHYPPCILDASKAEALLASMDSNDDKALTFSEMAWVVAGSAVNNIDDSLSMKVH
jgi:hypothetical protein